MRFRRVSRARDTSPIPALALHGISRSTFDQDLLVTNLRVLDDAFWDDLRNIAQVDVRRGDADDPLAGVVRLQRRDDRDVDLVGGPPPLAGGDARAGRPGTAVETAPGYGDDR